MCNEYCNSISNFINNFPSPLYVEIPNTFNEYFKLIKTDARTQYRKGIKNNLVVEEIKILTEQNHKDIIEIYNSTDRRQNRLMNKNYETLDYKILPIDTVWPINDYNIYSCDKHNLKLYSCKLNNKIVAILELLNSNTISIVHAIIGNKKYFNLGIMKYLFLSVVKLNIKLIKYLIYGDIKQLYKDNSRHFKKDLGIVNFQDGDLLHELAKS